MEDQIIETLDENGNLVKFKLYDIIEFDEKEYALLLAEDESDEIVLMRLSKDGNDYLFETIEDDEEFERVSQYIEDMEDEE